jgi:beta-galactosidase
MKSENPTLEWLSDPRVFAVNREEAHSDHKFYTSLFQAEQETEMPLKQSLNGLWKFHYTKDPHRRPADFYRLDFDCSAWGSIEVPGHIQMQGYGAPQYTNLVYPWDGESAIRPPEVPETRNPVGSYVRMFTLGPELEGKRIYLSFQGVETAFYVWLNGRFVGYSEDAFTPAEFEVTQYLSAGVNRIAVEVFQYGSASWIQDQDFWRFSGIFREVYLYAVPKAHVRDLFVTTEFAGSNYGLANVRVKMQLQLGCGVSADVVLEDANGKTRASVLKMECREQMALSIPVRNPRLWSAENPYLYRLIIHLYDAAGRTVEAVPQAVGVREFRMENGVMCLNGKRIVFHGVNRHEFDYRRGRAVTPEDLFWDIRFLKRNNINAVRTSHYPNQSEWYRLCDQYGVYLVDETNMESHGTWQKHDGPDLSQAVPGDREEWLGSVIDRANSMLQRDKNHPSVLIWSCGNESAGGRDIYEMSRFFHSHDPTRLVHYEGVFHDRRFNDSSDMESRMYAKPQDIREYLEHNPSKPYVSCEYMHAMGNSCGGMDEYAEMEEQYPKYQGGFLWDYIDQAILAGNAHGGSFLAYGGDFDDRPTDFAFCGNGIVYANRRPSPKVQEVKCLYQNVKLTPDEHGVLVKNQNLFVSTDDCYLEYSLLRGGETVFSGKIDCVVPADAQRYFRLELPQALQEGEYALNCSLRHKTSCLWAERGYEQAFGQHVWTVGGRPEEKNVPASARIVRGDVNLGVYGDGFFTLFSLMYGVVSMRKNDAERIGLPPVPVYWRAPTDNDRGNGYPFRCAPWYAAGKMQKLSDVSVSESGGSTALTYTYTLPAPVDAEVKVAYTVRPDGSLLVRADYPGAKHMPELPVFGLEFFLKEPYNRFQYYGMGPEENYIDRRCGARLGIFESTAQKNLSEYLVPQECGNRTGVRWAKVTAEDGTGLCFTAEDAPFEFDVLPYTAYELDNAAHRGELPESYRTVVRIAAKQMGVGGDDSWGAPVHDQYLIPSDRPISLSFRLTFCG